jgi:SAM-dependent methyltransferase
MSDPAAVTSLKNPEWHRIEKERVLRPEYLTQLLKPLEIPDGCVFVDVGCGSGAINAFVSFAKNLNLNIGLDLEPDTVRLARELNPEATAVRWLCASAEAIPLGNASVDKLVCRGVVPLANVRNVISEIGRVLRPGGTGALLLHSWSFYLKWLSLHPARWKRSAAGLVHFTLGTWFNLTGQQVVLRLGRHRIGQTYQALYRMRRMLAEQGMRLYHVKRRPELLIYVVKDSRS